MFYPNLNPLTIMKMRGVCLGFNHTKTTEPIPITSCSKKVYIPDSDIGLFPSQYHFSFQGDGLFSDVTKCQIDTFDSLDCF